MRRASDKGTDRRATRDECLDNSLAGLAARTRDQDYA
jgi:hypothetical protein